MLLERTEQFAFRWQEGALCRYRVQRGSKSCSNEMLVLWVALLRDFVFVLFCWDLMGASASDCSWAVCQEFVVNLQFMHTLGTCFLPAGFPVYHFDVCLGKVEMKVVCALGYFSVSWLWNVSWVHSATRSWPKKWRDKEALPAHDCPLSQILLVWLSLSASITFCFPVAQPPTC